MRPEADYDGQICNTALQIVNTTRKSELACCGIIGEKYAALSFVCCVLLRIGGLFYACVCDPAFLGRLRHWRSWHWPRPSHQHQLWRSNARIAPPAPAVRGARAPTTATSPATPPAESTRTPIGNFNSTAIGSARHRHRRSRRPRLVVIPTRPAPTLLRSVTTPTRTATGATAVGGGGGSDLAAHASGQNSVAIGGETATAVIAQTGRERGRPTLAIAIGQGSRCLARMTAIAIGQQRHRRRRQHHCGRQELPGATRQQFSVRRKRECGR